MRTRDRTLLAFALLAAAALAGCAMPVRFPPGPVAEEQTPEGFVQAYAVDHKGKADYFTTRGPDGRIVRIAYDTTGDGQADSFVNLDEIRFPDCRHVVIILDGMPLSVVEAYRQKGGLRLFHPPSRLVSTYPAMTDIALADAMASGPCHGLEAIYFNHHLNRLVGGDLDYLSMKNEQWAHQCDYRAGTLWDPISYVYPEQVFHKELGDILKFLARHDRAEVIAYLVSTAGLATREGEPGMVRILEDVDRLSQALVCQTRGLVKITLFSDHGHTMRRCVQLDFRPFLKGKGWRPSDRLRGPRDVVPIEYGLITYASFATLDRSGLAADLVQCQGVRFTSYEDGPAVAVRTADGLARVERRGDRYRYRADQGDPLQLLPVFEKLKSDGKLDADGFAADRALFEATATHTYPDACDRLWRAFHGLVENVPDVIADLEWGYYAGLTSRALFYRTAASTHGDLERSSSTAFLMSTAGPMPPVLRHRELPRAMQDLTGRPWPPPRGGRDR